MSDDAELLLRYARENSEPAFAELVRRHLGLVYHAALRQVGGDAHLAQDVAQTVFTDLARKAATLARRPVLAGWLYTSTRFAASQAVRSERRRRTREHAAHTMTEGVSEPASTADWERIRPVIDDALHALTARDREAVLLRFFEGRAFAEVGAAISASEDAARVRVDRALEQMRIAAEPVLLDVGAAEDDVTGDIEQHDAERSPPGQIVGMLDQIKGLDGVGERHPDQPLLCRRLSRFDLL